jgi:hypothetical protein
LERYFSGLSDKHENDSFAYGLTHNLLLHAVTVKKPAMFRYGLATVCKNEGLEWPKWIVADSLVLA